MQKADAGFTLIEVVVALSIFSVGLLSIAGMQGTAIRANSRANTLSVATSIAQGVLEEILAHDSDASLFASDVANVTWDLAPGVSATTLSMDGAVDYNATYTIDADNPVSDVARVDVRVTGGNRTVTLTGFKRTI